MFADVPHLIKSARNHFLDSSFSLNGVKTDKEYLQTLLEMNSGDLKVAFSLTSEHLTCVGPARQKVKLATQIFSNKNARALHYCLQMFNSGDSNFKQFVGCEETTRILQLFNDWFDLFNVRSKFDNRNGTSGYGVNLVHQKKILNSMTSYIREMRIGNHIGMIPFQKGIHLNNLSLQSLHFHLKEKFDVEYILTHRLNQDVLENFFSFIRGAGRANDHPNALDMKYRIRWYILGKDAMLALSNGCNTEKSTDKSLFNASDLDIVDINSAAVKCANSVFIQDTDVNKDDEDVEIDFSVIPLTNESDLHNDYLFCSATNETFNAGTQNIGKSYL